MHSGVYLDSIIDCPGGRRTRHDGGHSRGPSPNRGRPPSRGGFGFDAATALDPALEMVDPQPTLLELLVRHGLLSRERLPQIEINSIVQGGTAMERPLTVGQFARATGVPAKTIRSYEHVGVLPVPRRSEAGSRHYSRHDVYRLLFIRRARGLGLSLPPAPALVLSCPCFSLWLCTTLLHAAASPRVRLLSLPLAACRWPSTASVDSYAGRGLSGAPSAAQEVL